VKGGPLLAAALAVLASGCATRGTIAELGRPEFSGPIPAQLELTLVEPRTPGSFHAYPRGAGQGDYHCQIRMEEPPHRIQGDSVLIVMRATPTGDRKLKLFEIVAWPLHAKDEIRFKEDGHPPGPPEILRRVSVDKHIPDSEAFGLQVAFPASKLAGFDHIGVSALVQYEDGWITIIDSAVLAPTGDPPK
jgi:hypothetical protein